MPGNSQNPFEIHHDRSGNQTLQDVCYKKRSIENEEKTAHGHKFSAEDNKTLGSGWFCV